MVVEVVEGFEEARFDIPVIADVVVGADGSAGMGGNCCCCCCCCDCWGCEWTE